MFDSLFENADLLFKARYLLRQLTELHHTQKVRKVLDVVSPGWQQPAEENSQLYYELMYFFEYARVRAFSGYVPPKFQDR